MLDGTMNNAALDYPLPRADRSDGERYTSSDSSTNNGPAAKSTYDSDSSLTAWSENDKLHSTAVTRKPAADGHVNASSFNANQASTQRAEHLSCEKRPRKGHKKSRAGCYNCKRGKIKCQENQPACHNCTRRNMECIYPTLENLTGLHSSALCHSNPTPSVSLQSTPTVFTLTDMRLFHHYLMHSYPHLPVGNDAAWLHQVPLVAHQHQYLMHAILGFAASHLELLTAVDLKTTAMYHRVQAIKGSAVALSKTNRSGDDGDALVASCYLLTFQSTYMKEGIVEFLHFIRGCSLVWNQLLYEKVHLTFFLTAESLHEFMMPRLVALPVIDPELLESAQKSLFEVRLILYKPVHTMFHGLFAECIDAVKQSSLLGYAKFIHLYKDLSMLDNVSFKDLTDPANHVSKILIAHFFAVQIVMLPILAREWEGRTRAMPIRPSLDWISSISSSLPTHMRRYVEWPKTIADTVCDELAGKLPATSKRLILRKNEGLSRDII